MIRSVRSRLTAVLAVAAATAAGGLVLAAPTAQAAPSDCKSYLVSQGYSSTDTNLACTLGSSGTSLDGFLCRILLTSVSAVPPDIADHACTLAKS